MFSTGLLLEIVQNWILLYMKMIEAIKLIIYDSLKCKSYTQQSLSFAIPSTFKNANCTMFD